MTANKASQRKQCFVITRPEDEKTGQSVDTCEVVIKAGMGGRDIFHAEGRKHVLRLRAECGHC